MRWLEQHCDTMYYLCHGCGQGSAGLKPREKGCARLLRDAAGAGHVDMVEYCLDVGWDHSDDIIPGI